MSGHTKFTVSEIYSAFARGDRVSAVKMLRAETGVGLREAMDALNNRTVEDLPTFEQEMAQKRLERAAPELLAALKGLLGDRRNDDASRCVHCGRDNLHYEMDPCSDDCPGEIARVAIAKATGSTADLEAAGAGGIK